MALDLEVKAEFDNIKTALETKTASEVKTAIDALELKLADSDKKTQDKFADDLKATKEAMELKFLADIKAVQDHADALDVKLKGAKQIEVKNENFNDAIEKAVTAKSQEIEDFRDKKSKSVELEIKAVGDFSTANVTGGNRYGQVFAPDIIMTPSRKVHMDEILPGGTIGPGNSFTFMREVGVGEGSIAPVAEGALKPQFDLDLEEATVQVETIAGWIRVTRKAMSNIPGFISYLQRRLPQKFRNILDQQILYGSGTTPNLKGILTAGNFTASTATISLPLVEKIILDVSRLEDAFERDANFIAMRPSAYYSFFLNKASGSGEYDLPQGVTIVGGRLSFLGIPAYPTTALTSPDYIVGDMEGAQLLTQESMRIEFFEQDGTNVRENKVTVRIEGNFALPVYGSDYFIKGTTALA
jgi:HK97 family phage major capsid protein